MGGNGGNYQGKRWSKRSWARWWDSWERGDGKGGESSNHNSAGREQGSWGQGRRDNDDSSSLRKEIDQLKRQLEEAKEANKAPETIPVDAADQDQVMEDAAVHNSSDQQAEPALETLIRLRDDMRKCGEITGLEAINAKIDERRKLRDAARPPRLQRKIAREKRDKKKRAFDRAAQDEADAISALEAAQASLQKAK